MTLLGHATNGCLRDLWGNSRTTNLGALNRHYVENLMDGSATLIINQDLDEIDFLVTETELGISMRIATLFVMKIKEKTDVWDEFQVLLHRYRTLTRDGQGLPEVRISRETRPLQQ